MPSNFRTIPFDTRVTFKALRQFETKNSRSAAPSSPRFVTSRFVAALNLGIWKLNDLVSRSCVIIVYSAQILILQEVLHWTQCVPK